MAIHSLLAELDERTIAQKIGIPNDEVRMRFSLPSNTVSSFDEFTRIIGDYYNTHFTACISNGGNLSTSEAASRAKELIENEYRRRNGDIVTAFNDAHEGTNGGLRYILDIISEVKGVRFNWKDKSKGTDKEIGLIAQEVEKVLPELVEENDKGFKSIAYGKLTAVLTECVKELNEKYNSLENRLNAIEKQLNI